MSAWGQIEKNSVRANVFRVTPESGHCSMQPAYRKRANRRRTQRSNYPLYSISWSARSRNDSDIVRPSALAVLRLMISSNFVGFSTGSSLGRARRRILPAKEAARLPMACSGAPRSMKTGTILWQCRYDGADAPISRSAAPYGLALRSGRGRPPFSRRH
jgi:hypothetical protein